MKSYELPIDLEGAQDECTAIARHNRCATQLVCGSGADARLDRTAAPPDQRDRRTDN
jgi:hypothetical protein